jgi:purine nucleoside phosphorylase
MLAIIGGTGLCELDGLDSHERLEDDTPLDALLLRPLPAPESSIRTAQPKVSNERHVVPR